jgi:hypothetical protein
MTIEKHIQDVCMTEFKKGIADGREDNYYILMFGRLANKVMNATRKTCFEIYRDNVWQDRKIIKHELSHAVVTSI